MNAGKFILTVITTGFISLIHTSASAIIVSGSLTGGQCLTQGASFIKLSAPFTESDPDDIIGDDTL